MIDPMFTTCYSNYMTLFGKPSIDHVIILPVTSTYTIVDSFTTSALNKNDPDIIYLTSQIGLNDTQYYTEHSFLKLFGKTTNLSLFHLNIRSIPDHFLELTTFLNMLDIEHTVIALSETWIIPHHINYNLSNYVIWAFSVHILVITMVFFCVMNSKNKSIVM